MPQVKGAECLIIAGDPCQLAPFVQSPVAVQEQLEISLFERLQACPPEMHTPGST